MIKEIIYDCGEQDVKQHFNCIYMYVNKVNNKKYVGQTINLRERHRRHIKDSKTAFDKAINKYGIENFCVYILHEDVNSMEERNSLEELYIKKYNTLINEGCGYNIQKGGNNREMNELTKKKLSEGRKGKFKGKENPFYGKTHTEEVKQIIRETRDKHKHIYQSEEFRQKISETTKGEKNGMFGKTHSEETKQKISESLQGHGTKQVCQYDNKGNFIKVWTSIREASKQLNLQAPNITHCLQVPTHKAGDCYWRYYTDESSLNSIVIPRAKPRIAQYNLQGELIQVWESVSEIVETLGFNRSAIHNNIKRRNKSSHGYVWRYVNEDEQPEKIEKVTFRPRVLQYDKEGNLVKEWDSLTYVCENTDYKMAALNNCITGRSKTAYGYVWKYAN